MPVKGSLGKKYKAAIAAYDREELFSPLEAAEIVKKSAKAKFDESVEVAVRLGVDPRKAEQMIRGTVALPAGTGKTVRIAVFAAGDAAQAARDAGADLVGADELAAEIENAKTEIQQRKEEVALAQAQQPHHRLDQVRAPHTLRHRQPRVDHRLDLCRLAALPDQRQARVGRQIELGGLLDFEARHGRLGERLGCVIIQLHQCVRLESGLSEHGFRRLFSLMQA